MKIFTTLKLGAFLSAALFLFGSAYSVAAQTAPNDQQIARLNDANNTRYTRIAVTGEATINAQPDTAIINIGVVTQDATALGAQQANATKTDAVIRAVKDAAGADAEVKTSNYNLAPQYIYAQNQPPRISGYQASNSVMVTLRDLKRVGATIDASSQAGANTINSLSFTLRNDQAAREQALQTATRAALAKAKSLAQALDGRFVRVLAVQESGVSRPPIRPLYADDAARIAKASAAATPIETGSLEIRAEVELIAEVDTTAR
jgi:uncharacterized protein YggE